MTAEELALFHDIYDYLAIPRVSTLRLAPDRTWLAACVQTLTADRKEYLTSIWRIDAGEGPSRRLTRSAEGEGNPRFLPDGSMLFTSKRPDPDRSDERGSVNALWLLPASGGEARVIAMLPSGIDAIETAANAGIVVVSSPVLPDSGKKEGSSGACGALDGCDGALNGRDGESADTLAADEQLRKARRGAGVTAILHESVPVRYWDYDLGPDDLRLFAIEVPGEGEVRAASIRDLTPDAGRALLDQSFSVSADGTQVVTGWWQWRDGVQSHSEIVLIDVATGKRTTLLADPAVDYSGPRFSPDGKFVVTECEKHDTLEKSRDRSLVLVRLNMNGNTKAVGLVPGLDRWPGEPEWDGAASLVYFTADDEGRRPIFRTAANGPVPWGGVARVTQDHGYYTDLNVAPDGTVFAMRMAVDEPPTPVRVDPRTGEFTRLHAPGQLPTLPGTLTDVQTRADDGHLIHAWLVRPDTTDAPAPLLVWVHGGPMLSWNNWSWRWNPWLMAARGYAVLLPDPALSTGYGQDFVQRGHHNWGDRPFRDIMAVTDETVKRDDIDETRLGMMGYSYGGYMANWVAGHTDRFKAIVSHAGPCFLDQMSGTTDGPHFWWQEFGDPRAEAEIYQQNSPHLHVASITTPMLVIHGGKDYRVPLSEAQRLWWDLKQHGKEAKFLYFPDENHWILTPGNIKVWYETVWAFLSRYVLAKPWRRPELL